MIVKGSAVLQAGIRGEFIRAYQLGPTMVPQLCTIIPSNKDSETYGWLGEVAAIREWLGEREIKGFTDSSFSIKNKKWEGTIGIERTEIEDDQTGGIMTRARDLGNRARQHPDDLLWQTVAANPVGYDGVSLFNASHPARTTEGSAQANTFAGTGVTVAALTADLGTAIANMRLLKDERGKPFWPSISSEDLMIVVPPALEVNMRTVLNATIINNTTNILVGAAKSLYVNPWLTDVNDWFVLNFGGVVKPYIFQDREPIELTDRGIDSEKGFMEDMYVFGSRARYNVGPGLWQGGQKITN